MSVCVFCSVACKSDDGAVGSAFEECWWEQFFVSILCDCVLVRGFESTVFFLEKVIVVVRVGVGVGVVVVVVHHV